MLFVMHMHNNGYNFFLNGFHEDENLRMIVLYQFFQLGKLSKSLKTRIAMLINTQPMAMEAAVAIESAIRKNQIDDCP